MTKKISKKARAFQLFVEGKDASSQEVKDLKLPGTTRHTYYWEWNKLGRPSGPETLSEKPKDKMPSLAGKQLNSIHNKVEAKEKVKPISDTPVAPPSETEDESLLDDNSDGKEAKDEEQKPTIESEHSDTGGSNGKKPIANVIATTGLVITSVEISAKTYMLWQLAKAQNECTFGDFVDSCVEDAFNGRGLDIGLLRIGGKKNGQ